MTLAITGKVFPPLFNRSDTMAIVGIVLSKLFAVSAEDGLRFLGMRRMRQRYSLVSSALVVAIFIALAENILQFGRVSTGLAVAGQSIEPGMLIVIFIAIGVARLLWHFTLCRYYVVFADNRAWSGVVFLFVLHVLANSVLALLPFYTASLEDAFYWACVLFLVAASLAYGACRNWPSLSRG
ncbi:hypothetical protein P8R33_10900 [Qipengyuania sp. XHP0211]|uniref:hypothetical protein n=1 Tax=Qipengyuania sp. XHP0211 TaxID=3038079 RepID=UPI00241FEC1F|nr:hypothetical protein [Qipengyuania sp. XHP0211]MDG5751615.1 hypothetical protein [Qipengyuania sp. XHP0211]